MIRVSESELELMKVLWERAPQTLPELLENAGEKFSWEESTVKTLLQRLLKKGAIEREGEKRSYTYRPLVSAFEYKKNALRQLEDKVFNSNLSEMFCFFAKHESLSKEEIRKLEAILKKGNKEENTENESVHE